MLLKLETEQDVRIIYRENVLRSYLKELRLFREEEFGRAVSSDQKQLTKIFVEMSTKWYVI